MGQKANAKTWLTLMKSGINLGMFIWLTAPGLNGKVSLCWQSHHFCFYFRVFQCLDFGILFIFFLFPLLFEVYDSNNSIWKPISISNNFDLFMLFFEEVWRGLKVVIILPRQIALIGFLDRFEIVFSICYSSLQQTWQSFLLFFIFLLQKL